MPTNETDLTECYEEDQEDEGDEEEDDEEDEGPSIMFVGRADLLTFQENVWKSIGVGLLKILYDSEIYGAAIILEVDHTGDIVSNTVISMETMMEVSEKNPCSCKFLCWFFVSRTNFFKSSEKRKCVHMDCHRRNSQSSDSTQSESRIRFRTTGTGDVQDFSTCKYLAQYSFIDLQILCSIEGVSNNWNNNFQGQEFAEQANISEAEYYDPTIG